MSFWRRSWSWIGAGVAFSACAVTVSKDPLHNARPEGPDVYFYGTPTHGGKRLEPRQETAQPAPLVLPKPPALVRPKPKKLAKLEAKPQADAGGSAGTSEAGAPVEWAGRYAGTDTVIVAFPGIPPDPQVDENAKMDVAKLSDTRLSATVVDSQRGVPLCTVEGDISLGKIELDPDQECFTDMIGIPVDTALVEGSGRIEGEKLEIEFLVEMSIDTPSGVIEGSIDFHFEGVKVKGPDSERKK